MGFFSKGSRCPLSSAKSSRVELQLQLQLQLMTTGRGRSAGRLTAAGNRRMGQVLATARKPRRTIRAETRGRTSLSWVTGGSGASSLDNSMTRRSGAGCASRPSVKLTRPILVDLTASDTTPELEEAIAAGMDLVLANKRPLADVRDATRGLARHAAAHGRRVLHEATVGAGLPLLDTISKLQESGDAVLAIEGCPSGTLGYLFGEIGRGIPFSTSLRTAMALGYTEPDPRVELSGM